jgi:hypothetical protein
MHGQWLSSYLMVRSHQTTQFRPSLYSLKENDVGFDRTDDLRIFARLALVVALFSAALACIVWIAS